MLCMLIEFIRYSTTTELTSSWASGISTAVGLSSTNRFVEVVIRAVCSLITVSLELVKMQIYISLLPSFPSPQTK